MALCLAESLIESRGYDPEDQMQRYLRWYRHGHLSSNGTCFDIGNATRSALEHFSRTGQAYSGSCSPYSAGNGSIMRLAPMAMYHALSQRSAQEIVDQCGESSRTTHGAMTTIDGCRYFGALLVGALRGESKETLLSSRYCPGAGCWEAEPLCPEIDEVAQGSFKMREPPEIQGSGYVVRSLEAALWAFFHSTSFAHGCRLAVNLGDDADTTGAVYGQIAGAYYGVEGIPSHWREQLAMRDLIEDYARRLLALSQA
jgi:ADP-ribosyl-[dinitrogen reductase] hydrolase